MKQQQQWQQPKAIPILTADEDLADLNWSAEECNYITEINAGELLHTTPEFSNALWS